LGRGSRCAVADCPYRFFLDFDVIMDQQLYQFVHDAHVNALLDLLLIPGSDVRERPAHLLPHSFLLVEYYIIKSLERTCFNHILSLPVIPCHNIANSSQTRNCDSDVVML
jgi:hypothetical protein